MKDKQIKKFLKSIKKLALKSKSLDDLYNSIEEVYLSIKKDNFVEENTCDGNDLFANLYSCFC